MWMNNVINAAWVQDGASICKYVGILPYPFDVVEHYMLHAKYVNEFDANVMNQRTVQYMSYEELKEQYPDKDMQQGRSVCVMLYDVKFPFPFAKRIYCVNSTAFHDPETQESLFTYISKFVFGKVVLILIKTLLNQNGDMSFFEINYTLIKGGLRKYCTVKLYFVFLIELAVKSSEFVANYDLLLCTLVH
jgi:hypothetical protein